MDKINLLVDRMATNSQESTKNSTKILNDISRTTASMEQVSATVGSQAILAQDLTELIEGFKI